MYALLLDSYYATERPLPAQLESLYRICRAMTRAEKQAVDSVAAQFFPVSDDGLRHNKRADREIPEAQRRIQTARKNGVLGGRPKKASKNPPGSTTETGGKPSGIPSPKPDENLPYPNPIGFQQVENDRVASQPSSGEPPDSEFLTPSINGHDVKFETTRRIRASAVEILGFLNEKAGKNFGPTKENIGWIVGRLRDGATPQQCRQVIARQAREWKGDQKMWKYMRPETLFNPTKFSSYVGELVDIPDESGAAA